MSLFLSVMPAELHVLSLHYRKWIVCRSLFCLLCHSSSFLALGTKNITVKAPTAPAVGTMMRAMDPAGMKTKVESSTIAVIMPTAPAFCVAVIPPRR